jgi:hypothetical protein
VAACLQLAGTLRHFAKLPPQIGYLPLNHAVQPTQSIIVATRMKGFANE